MRMKKLVLLTIALLLARSLDAATIYEQKFAEWSDSFTLPQSTSECHRWFTTDASSGVNFQVCSKWDQTEQIYKQVEVFLVVDGPITSDDKFLDILSSCTTITILSQFAPRSSPLRLHVFSSAAVEAAQSVFAACLGASSKSTTNRYGIRIETRSRWE